MDNLKFSLGQEQNDPFSRNNSDEKNPEIHVAPLKCAVKRIKPASLTQNLDDARKLYDLLGGGVQCFQIFPESKELKSRPDKELARFTRHQHGTFEELAPWLVEANEYGCGVYIGINRTDGNGRKNSNITAVRGVFADMDGAPLAPVLQARPAPHIITKTSPGHFHPIWLVSDCGLEMFRPIQTALAQRFDCDDKVGDPARVMRMPGFFHWKHEPVLSEICSVNDGPPYSIYEVMSGLKLTVPNPNSQEALRDENTRAISSDSILLALDNNELGDSELFQRLMKGRYCYDHAAGEWMKWTGHYWTEDNTEDVFAAVSEVINLYEKESNRQSKLRVEANRAQKEDKAREAKINTEKLLRRIRELQTVRRIKNVIWLSRQGSGSLGISGEEWDKDPWVLGVTNGKIDLHDGSWRPGQQADFIRTVAPTEWRGLDEPCPTWEKTFLRQIIVDDEYQPDDDTLDYLHRLLGYSMLGEDLEHVFPILYGPFGRNGKGTMVETIASVIGNLARKISKETLLLSGKPQSGSAHRADLMSFKGARICWASETGKKRKLDSATVKELAGNDTINARPPHGTKEINWKPTHTLFLLTNNKPDIPAKTTDPIWDRITLIPFHLKYVDEPNIEVKHERKKDKDLPKKLIQEKSGILAWLVRGCLKWQKNGLKKSPAVKQATASYQNSQNILGQFIADCCKRDTKAKVQAKDLYNAYRDWCEEQGLRADSQRRFGGDISLMLPKEETNVVYYLDVELKTKTN